MPLRVELQLRIVSDDDTVIRDEVILQLDRSDDRLETIGLCLKDSKDLLGRLQHAVVEAQALSMRLHSAFIGQPPTRILVTGGASKNPGILRVLADVFQAEIVPLRVSNSSALGGALRAAQAVEGRPWAELYARFAAPALDRRVAPDKGSKVTYEGLSTQLQDRLKDLLAQTTPTR